MDVTTENNLQKEYNELGRTKKSLLHTGFMEDHGYKTQDTFYKKMRGEIVFYPNEQKWLAKFFNKSIESLF